jgi:hypothetical protein
MPFEVPSQRGFTKTGKAPGSAASRASSAERITTCPGTGTPAAATSVRAQCLSSATDKVTASEPSVGIPAIASSTGAQASRSRPPQPSAIVSAASISGSSPFASRASRSCGAPSRTLRWPRRAIAASSNWMVASGSNSASTSAGSHGRRG